MAVAVASIDVLAEAQSSTITLTKPASTAENDLLLVHIQTRNDGSGTGGNSVNSVPSGWTLGKYQKGTGSGNAYSTGQYYWKVAGSSEPSSYDFGLEGSIYYRASIWRITGGRIGSPIYTDNSSFQLNSSTPSLSVSVTPATASSLIIQLWDGVDGANSSGSYAIATDNPSWTEGYSVSMTVGGSITGRFVSAYAVRTETSATGNMSLSGGGVSSDWVGIIIVIPPVVTSTISETLTLTEAYSYIRRRFVTVLDTITASEAYQYIKGRLWRKRNKPSTTWTSRNK